MKEFHCSREVATLGLSLFVLGLAFGPMLLGPLSEVCCHLLSTCARLTMPATVLRPKTNLHWLLVLLPHLADPLRCRTKYSNHARRQIYQRLCRQCVPCSRGRHGGRSFRVEGHRVSHDGFFNFSFSGTKHGTRSVSPKYSLAVIAFALCPFCPSTCLGSC